jgi:hypothetical protein
MLLASLQAQVRAYQTWLKKVRLTRGFTTLENLLEGREYCLANLKASVLLLQMYQFFSVFIPLLKIGKSS